MLRATPHLGMAIMKLDVIRLIKSVGQNEKGSSRLLFGPPDVG
jgi:hypothetical protein